MMLGCIPATCEADCRAAGATFGACFGSSGCVCL
jgi:hypothetical protein